MLLVVYCMLGRCTVSYWLMYSVLWRCTVCYGSVPNVRAVYCM